MSGTNGVASSWKTAATMSFPMCLFLWSWSGRGGEGVLAAPQDFILWLCRSDDTFENNSAIYESSVTHKRRMQ